MSRRHQHYTPTATAAAAPSLFAEPTPLERAERGSAESAGRWTDSERGAVRDAIRRLAESRPQFTSDDVWRELGDHFPVTKGLASMFNAAARHGWIEATSSTVVTRRGGDHDHAQRLVVWRSLLYGAR